MRSYNRNHEVRDQTEPAFVGNNSRAAEPRPTYMRNSSARSAQHRSLVGGTRARVTLRNGTAELLAEIDGLPVLFRIFVRDFPARLQSDFGAKGADIHTLLSSTLERAVDLMRGSSPQRDAPSKSPSAIVELVPSGELPAPMPIPSNDMVLRVGPLELDLLDRVARRGDRKIDLRPREFQLLKYMMQRSDKLLTRGNLFKEVWHYKFVPETNLVDVHMGRLRRKVDGPNEAHMIRNVRGAGFVLSAAPVPEDLPVERSTALVTEDGSPQSVGRILQ
jgi:DNA-binding winged helix-turn-helix (wHTH) protein